MSIELQFGDADANSTYVQRRLATGIALLILFLVHFVFQFLTYFASAQKFHKHKIDHLSKKLYFYLIACLISYNYLQGNVFGAVLAWVTLVMAIVLHFTTLKSFDKPDLESKLWLVYYAFVWIFFLGIIIGYYKTS